MSTGEKECGWLASCVPNVDVSLRTSKEDLDDRSVALAGRHNEWWVFAKVDVNVVPCKKHLY
jgi:hypothetical protein